MKREIEKMSRSSLRRIGKAPEQLAKIEFKVPPLQ